MTKKLPYFHATAFLSDHKPQHQTKIARVSDAGKGELLEAMTLWIKQRDFNSLSIEIRDKDGNYHPDYV